MTENRVRVLLAGETWMTYETHIKGFDSFTVGRYGDGTRWIRRALEQNDVEFHHIPNHLAPSSFPSDMDALSEYSVVILSDIGSNTLTLHPDTLDRSLATPNRLELLRDYVVRGGGLVMIGGWMSFQGIEGKAHYRGSPIEEALPVALMPGDDRVEVPQGINPEVVAEHPITEGLPKRWPQLLSYNRIAAKSGASLLAAYGDDPMLVVHGYGDGRAVAFAADCAPHGASDDFLEWEHYPTLWSRIVKWAAGRL